jgi:site-specific recombinase XerD
MTIDVNEPLKLRQLRDVNCEQSNEDLLQEFLKDMRVAGLAEQTITSYGPTCKDFLSFICGLNIRQATHHEVREWLHWLYTQGASSQTLAHRKYALSSFFKFLERMGLIASSPTRLVPNRKIHRHLPRHHSVEEMNKLLAACDNVRDLALLSTLWATGCRRAELPQERAYLPEARARSRWRGPVAAGSLVWLLDMTF